MVKEKVNGDDPTIRSAVLAALDTSSTSDPTSHRSSSGDTDDDIVEGYSQHLWSERSFGGVFEATILAHHSHYQHLQIFSISWHEGGGVVPLGHAPHANRCAFVAWVHKNHYALLWRLPLATLDHSKSQVIFPLMTAVDIQAIAAQFGKQLATDRLPSYTDDEVMEITAND